MSHVPAFRTDWSDEALFELLDGEHPAIKSIVENRHQRPAHESREMLVEHLKNRTAPMWLFDGRDGSRLPSILPWPIRQNLSPEEIERRAERALDGKIELNAGLELDLCPDFRWRTEETTNLGVPGNAFSLRSCLFPFCIRVSPYLAVTVCRRITQTDSPLARRMAVRSRGTVRSEFADILTPERIQNTTDGYAIVPLDKLSLHFSAVQPPYPGRSRVRFIQKAVFYRPPVSSVRRRRVLPGQPSHHAVRYGSGPTGRCISGSTPVY